jgi:hypothetical protein
MWRVSGFGDIAWPRVRPVAQPLPGPREDDVSGAVEREIARVADRVHAGRTYAVGVGSRGVQRIAEITRAVVSALRRRGADAFIVPAMGSHGGATADGQREVLASLGVTESSVGAPIDARMEVEEVDRLDDGTRVFFSQAALKADGVIPINRVKPHTAFRGPVESGIAKMLVIGFGKQQGAASIHRLGMSEFGRVIPLVARRLLERVPVAFGIAVVENGREEVAEIRALAGERILEDEPPLLERARQWMARLPFEQIDVLVVGQMGKNISGDGMDPNITGRYGVTGMTGGPRVERLVVLHLTPETRGNANGMGMADIISEEAYRAVDWAKTYVNALTYADFVPVKTPAVLASDRDAIEMALRTVHARPAERARMVFITNTLRLERFVISEALAEEARARAHPAGRMAVAPV